LVTGTTTTVGPSVELTALVTPSNSTSQFFAGTTYYGHDYTTTDGPQQVVPFLLGPQGIVNAIDQNAGDPDGIVVLSSGWGAGQTGTALAMMEARPGGPPNNIKLVILDNNSNFPAGGFWTTYYPFAPLLFTSAEPSPKDVTVPVIETAYEYNVNSNAVTYPINLISDVNSLVAYAYGYGGEARAPMPSEAFEATPDGAHFHYVVAPNGDAVPVYELNPETDGNVTYVTFKSDGLPLLRPVRLLPGGDILADTLEPVLTEIVNAGYKDNEPIQANPTLTRPMGLLPASETMTMLSRLPGAVETGVHNGLATAQADLSSPANFVTKPLAEVGKLPGISSPNSASTASTLKTNTVTTNGTNKSSSAPDKTSVAAPPDHPKPLKRIAEKITGGKHAKADDGPSAK
jgi:hypothetical protein